MTSGVSNMLKLLFPFAFAHRFGFSVRCRMKLHSFEPKLIQVSASWVEKHEENSKYYEIKMNAKVLKKLNYLWMMWRMDIQKTFVIPHSGWSEASPYAISMAFV